MEEGDVLDGCLIAVLAFGAFVYLIISFIDWVMRLLGG